MRGGASTVNFAGGWKNDGDCGEQKKERMAAAFSALKGRENDGETTRKHHTAPARRGTCRAARTSGETSSGDGKPVGGDVAAPDWTSSSVLPPFL